MIPFQPIRLSDREAINRLLRASRAPICDHTFTNLYAWQERYSTAWAEVEHRLVVRYRIEADAEAYMVVGLDESDFDRVMPRLKAEAEMRHQPLRLVCLAEQDVEQFRRWVKRTDGDEDEYAVCDNRDYRDYIYSLEELHTLRGRRFQPKRNHVNRFESLYNYRFEPLRKEHFEECLQLECLWQRRKGNADCRESEEQQAIRRVLEAYDELDVVGGVLLIEGHVAAFTFGSAIDSETFCTHVEKADAGYEGIFPMINRCFAGMLLERGFRWVNREEDMGLAGLRRSKLSYHPHRLQEKMSIKHLSPVERGCRRLWMEVFGDEQAMVDLFLTEIARPENTFVHCQRGEVVSMLHLVDLQTDYGRTAYLYAIATATEWRQQGLASTLIDEALEAARQRGYDAAMLIPADEEVVGLYARFGFDAPSYKMDFSDGFDLGTGDKDRDVAMVMRLR